VIVTMTLNPSLDRTIEVDALIRGEVIRAKATRLDPGGKGVNVSRALLAGGVASRAVVPVGGPNGEQLTTLLRAEGIAVRAVRVGGPTRSNVTIVEPGGVVTKLNEPGGRLSRRELDLITGVVRAEAETASWAVACGSLPPGVPSASYAEFCRRMAETATKVAIDSSGPALASVIEAGPDLVKPNREELAEVTGQPLDQLADVIQAAEELRERGAKAVLVSLGADGAVLVDRDGVIVGQTRAGPLRSTVGAGDALLAGFLSAGARGPGALAEAIAWGTAAVRLPANQMPRRADLSYDVVRIEARPDPGRPLCTRPLAEPASEGDRHGDPIHP
jgi:1-phosphofructokinase